MKKYFITGLVILLPLTLTLIIISFVFNLLTEPFVGLIKSIFDHYRIFKGGFGFFSSDQVQKFISQVIILVLLFFFAVGLGFLARWFFFHYLVRFWEYILKRIPFVSSIYITCQDVIKSLFTTQSNSFKQVVMVPFPSKIALTMGLITNDTLPALDQEDEPFVAVFVPTTPNPTSGYLMMFKKKDMIYLDMKVEDAFKYIISCGMISSSMNVISAEEAKSNLKKRTTHKKTRNKK